jgi:hypothetical protein
MTSKLEAVFENHFCSLKLIKKGVWLMGGGELSAAPSSTCLMSRYNGCRRLCTQGGTSSTVPTVSLSPSPPFSFLCFAAKLIKIFAFSVQNNNNNNNNIMERPEQRDVIRDRAMD